MTSSIPRAGVPRFTAASRTPVRPHDGTPAGTLAWRSTNSTMRAVIMSAVDATATVTARRRTLGELTVVIVPLLELRREPC